MGLMFLAKAAQAEQGRPLIDEAMAAVAKLTATVPQPLRDAGSELLATVSIDAGDRGRGDHESERYAVLHKAIDEGRVCRVHYKSPVEDEPQTLDIEPYLLHFAVRAWYVFARSRQHEQVRLFKLTRMDKLEALPHRLDKPSRFTASKKLGKAWRLIPEGRIYRIELEFSAKVGTNVSEVRWHESQQHEVLDDGRCVMKFEVDGLGEIAWWLCGYADQVKVRRPEALRTRLHAMHRDAAAVLNGKG